MEDVITIRISRRAIRLFLLGVAAFLILGFLVPVVPMSVSVSHAPNSGYAKPAQTP
jgi:hypothetical protein